MWSYVDVLLENFLPEIYYHLIKDGCNNRGQSGGNLLVVNMSRPEENGWYFADNFSKWIFLNVSLCVLIRMSLNYVPKDLINNKSTLVQVNGLVPNR